MTRRHLLSVDDSTCAVRDGETYSQHIRRCQCDIPLFTWTGFDARARARDVGDTPGKPEDVADQIVDALADANVALLRVARLAARATAHDSRSFQSIAEVTFRAVAVDHFPIDPDGLLSRSADARGAIWDLLLHVGNVSDYEGRNV